MAFMHRLVLKLVHTLRNNNSSCSRGYIGIMLYKTFDLSE